MTIPESTLMRIKDEADIVKIISEYIKLEKKSSSYIGLCPFHPDQNPSLHVSPTKKIYKCFSCGASGDVIKFIENYEKVSFPRALQIAGEKIGINVELGNDENVQVYTKYYNILSQSANFYHFLLENTADGVEAKKYLYKRNLNDEIINRFNIGLSADEPDLLYKSLLEENFQPLDMIEAGVVRSLNTYIDVFRNRIMFPLDDINGKIVGFSGRIYTDVKKEEPKYINSSENKIFKKGNILYNFSNAQNYIRNKDFVFIFEGFMDVIAAYRCNIHNAVATMGTSISINQIKTLKKTTNNIVLCYDGDTPGIEASKKAILQFLKADFNVEAVLIPDGFDPDEYLNKYGNDKLSDLLLNNHISGYDFLYETTKKEVNFNSLSSIEKFKNDIFKYLNYFKSNVLNERFFLKLSEDISVSVESLRLDFANVSKDNYIKTEYYDNNYQDTNIIDFEVTSTFDIKQKHVKKKYINASRNLLKIAYLSKVDSSYIKLKLNDRFVDKLHNMLFAQIFNFYNKNDEMDDARFKANLSKDEETLLYDVLKNPIPKVEQTLIDDCISNIHKFYLEEHVQELKEKLKKNPNDDEINKLYTKYKNELTNYK